MLLYGGGTEIDVKKYRTYTAKKYKIWKKIIFFAIVAAVIFTITVIVGNNLKNKLESSNLDETEPFVTTAPDNDKDKEKVEPSVPHDEAFMGVSAGYLDLSGITESANVASVIEKLKADGFNAVSFTVTDSNGMITYKSPAVEAESRLPSSDKLIPFSVLESAVIRAKNMGMSVVGVMTASESLSDPIIASELSELGFDSIIVRGFEDHITIDNSAVDEIKRYTEGLRKGCDGDVAISVSFVPEFYRSPKNAPYLEKLYKACEFLTIDMTEATEEETKSLVIELAGSFSAYRLRPLLLGDADEAEKISAVLSEASVNARQYISAIKKNDDTTDNANN